MGTAAVEAAAQWSSVPTGSFVLTGGFAAVIAVQVYCLVRIARRRQPMASVRRWWRNRLSARGLFDAITHEQIEPFYQPIVRAGDGVLVGFESLARWRHPRRGVLTAGAFLDHAERQGQMAAVDRRMLTAVARDLPSLMSRLDPSVDPFVTVNLSPWRLAQPGYASEILDLLASEDLVPDGLVIEMTEASAVVNWTSFIDNISRFQEAGIGLAIDDFGAGHTNLTLLCQLDVDLIKLDRKVVELAMTVRGSAIVEGSIATARATGALIVAEGVSDMEWVSTLSKLGADFVQGFSIGYPVPLDELPAPLTSMGGR